MQNKLKIESEIDLVTTLKMLAQAYEEISVLKMQRVRSSVLLTRDFLDRLSLVFSDVKSSYAHMRSKHAKKNKNISSFSTGNKNGKTVSIFISANAKFYGDIVQKVFYLFINNIKIDQSDIVIMGRSGKEFYDHSGLKKPYQYYDLPEGVLSLEDIKPIVNLIINYEHVNVYYGRFANVINQIPTRSDVTGAVSMDAQLSEKKQTVQFFFEPSLDQVMSFFENQVFISLFEQTVHESELSRVASRIRAMEEALGNIEKTEGKLASEQRRIKKHDANKKALDNLNGIYFLSWK